MALGGRAQKTTACMYRGFRRTEASRSPSGHSTPHRPPTAAHHARPSRSICDLPSSKARGTICSQTRCRGTRKRPMHFDRTCRRRPTADHGTLRGQILFAVISCLVPGPIGWLTHRGALFLGSHHPPPTEPHRAQPLDGSDEAPSLRGPESTRHSRSVAHRTTRQCRRNNNHQWPKLHRPGRQQPKTLARSTCRDPKPTYWNGPRGVRRT